MGIILFVVGMCNIWMCGAQCTSIYYEKGLGNHVPNSKYFLAGLDAVLGMYLLIAAIGHFVN